MSDHAIDFDDMVGGEFDFYGCDGQCFSLDGLVYEVGEDGDVGLASDRSGFHALPIARVVVEHACFNDSGYELIDLHDGHCWLCFGEELVDTDYATQFVFEYTPKDMES